MAANLEQRLRLLEHRRQEVLTILIRSFRGKIDDPVTTSLARASRQWTRAPGESVDGFRRRALAGHCNAGAGGAVVLHEQNASGPELTSPTQPQGGCR